MLRVRIELTTSASLMMSSHTLYKYGALTDCATGALPAVHLHLSSDAYKHYFAVEKMLLVRIELTTSALLTTSSHTVYKYGVLTDCATGARFAYGALTDCATGTLLAVHLHLSSDAYKHYFGEEKMHRVRIELTTSAFLMMSSHTLYKYGALTDCATGALPAVHLHLSSDAYKHYFAVEKMLLVRIELTTSALLTTSSHTVYKYGVLTDCATGARFAVHLHLSSDAYKHYFGEENMLRLMIELTTSASLTMSSQSVYKYGALTDCATGTLLAVHLHLSSDAYKHYFGEEKMHRMRIELTTSASLMMSSHTLYKYGALTDCATGAILDKYGALTDCATGALLAVHLHLSSDAYKHYFGEEKMLRVRIGLTTFPFLTMSSHTVNKYGALTDCATGTLLAVHLHLSSDKYKHYFGEEKMLRVRIELTTSASLMMSSHTLYKYGALTDCATGALPAVHLHLSSDAYKHYFAVEKMLRVRIELTTSALLTTSSHTVYKYGVLTDCATGARFAYGALTVCATGALIAVHLHLSSDAYKHDFGEEKMLRVRIELTTFAFLTMSSHTVYKYGGLTDCATGALLAVHLHLSSDAYKHYFGEEKRHRVRNGVITSASLTMSSHSVYKYGALTDCATGALRAIHLHLSSNAYKHHFGEYGALTDCATRALLAVHLHLSSDAYKHYFGEENMLRVRIELTTSASLMMSSHTVYKYGALPDCATGALLAVHLHLSSDAYKHYFWEEMLRVRIELTTSASLMMSSHTLYKYGALSDCATGARLAYGALTDCATGEPLAVHLHLSSDAYKHYFGEEKMLRVRMELTTSASLMMSSHTVYKYGALPDCATGALLDVHLHLSSDAYKHYFWEEMLRVRIELTTSASLTLSSHTVNKYGALTDCATGALLAVHKHLSSDAYKQYFGEEKMLRVRIELTTSASLTMSSHSVYMYGALTDCATGAPLAYGALTDCATGALLAVHLHLSSDAYKHYFGEEKMLRVRIELTTSASLKMSSHTVCKYGALTDCAIRAPLAVHLHLSSDAYKHNFGEEKLLRVRIELTTSASLTMSSHSVYKYGELTDCATGAPLAVHLHLSSDAYKHYFGEEKMLGVRIELTTSASLKMSSHTVCKYGALSNCATGALLAVHLHLSSDAYKHYFGGENMLRVRIELTTSASLMMSSHTLYKYGALTDCATGAPLAVHLHLSSDAYKHYFGGENKLRVRIELTTSASLMMSSHTLYKYGALTDCATGARLAYGALTDCATGEPLAVHLHLSSDAYKHYFGEEKMLRVRIELTTSASLTMSSHTVLRRAIRLCYRSTHCRHLHLSSDAYKHYFGEEKMLRVRIELTTFASLTMSSHTVYKFGALTDCATGALLAIRLHLSSNAYKHHFGEEKMLRVRIELTIPASLMMSSHTLYKYGALTDCATGALLAVHLHLSSDAYKHYFGEEMLRVRIELTTSASLMMSSHTVYKYGALPDCATGALLAYGALSDCATGALLAVHLHLSSDAYKHYFGEENMLRVRIELTTSASLMMSSHTVYKYGALPDCATGALLAVHLHLSPDAYKHYFGEEMLRYGALSDCATGALLAVHLHLSSDAYKHYFGEEKMLRVRIELTTSASLMMSSHTLYKYGSLTDCATGALLAVHLHLSSDAYKHYFGEENMLRVRIELTTSASLMMSSHTDYKYGARPDCATGSLLAVHLHLSSDAYKHYFGEEMLRVRLELTTSASLTMSSHSVYKYGALTDCATGAPLAYGALTDCATGELLAIHLHLSSNAYKHHFGEEKMLRVRIELTTSASLKMSSHTVCKYGALTDCAIRAPLAVHLHLSSDAYKHNFGEEKMLRVRLELTTSASLTMSSHSVYKYGALTDCATGAPLAVHLHLSSDAYKHYFREEKISRVRIELTTFAFLTMSSHTVNKYGALTDCATGTLLAVHLHLSSDAYKHYFGEEKMHRVRIELTTSASFMMSSHTLYKYGALTNCATGAILAVHLHLSSDAYKHYFGEEMLRVRIELTTSASLMISSHTLYKYGALTDCATGALLAVHLHLSSDAYKHYFGKKNAPGEDRTHNLRIPYDVVSYSL
ncbi:unnamed protein product [Acanthosepion pharaonis]|uniref:Uncharacterized protein n=1 Tax=Acanthosepion pharaonis TaxID=158019 RepID=A0A812DLS1_ACAPH|nr:unnamed protein product [Sepia pharaonis]